MTKKAIKRTTKKAASKKAASTPAPKVGALSAASLVLKAVKAPMTCGELIKAMAAKKLWDSPRGKMPVNNLHAAITKEINSKRKESRFAKSERGKFEAA